MRTLGMARQRHDGGLQRLQAPCHVACFQGLDHVTEDVGGTHRHLTRGPGSLHDQWGHVGQKPLPRCRGNRRPHQPLEHRGIFGVKGMQIGRRLPCFQPYCHWPAPFLGSTDPLEGVARRWHVRQQGANGRVVTVPADDHPQAERLSISLPPHEKLDALPFRPLGVERWAGRVPERPQACAILPERCDALGMHPRFGPDEHAAVRIRPATPRAPIEGAALGKSQRVLQGGRRGPKRLRIGCRRGQDDGRGGITPPIHRRMPCARCGLDGFATPGEHLTEGLLERQRTAILDHDVAQRRTGPPPGAPEDVERHVPDESRGQGAGAISQTWRRHVVRERFVRDGRVTQRRKAPGDISQRLHALAGTGRRQRATQAQGGHGPLPAAQLHVFAPGVAPRFGTPPLALVSDHAQLSVIHRALLSLYQKQLTQLEFRMDPYKIQQQNQILKSTYL
jgi:hypothetical protein